jgi:osmotically-inducible protein OsmY
MRYLVIALPLALASLPLLHGCAVVAVGAAAGSGYVVGEDRRTATVMADDQRTEFKVHDHVRAQHPNGHINATSYNRLVLLTGESPSEKDKTGIEVFARGVEGVRDIYNEIKVGPNSALTARANDTFISSIVKTRLLDSGKLNPLHVKVVTEAGVVYLMGIVKRQEANVATDLARTTSGVQRVVRMFEYQD